MCSKVFRDVLKCSEVFQSVLKCSEGFKMFKGGWRRIKYLSCLLLNSFFILLFSLLLGYNIIIEEEEAKMERNIIQAKIEEKIKKAPRRTLYFLEAFSEFGDYTSIKEAISRLVTKGTLTQVSKGVYMKTYFSTLLQENTTPNVYEVAKKIAKKNKWAITLEGNTALNSLGLSTQVPASYYYASSGRSRNIRLETGIVIHFKHVPAKEIVGLCNKNAQIVEAIKTIGKNKLRDRDYAAIKRLLGTEVEKKLLLKETGHCRKWVKQEIGKILEK